MHDASVYSNANPHEMARYLAPFFNAGVATIAKRGPALLGTANDPADVQPVIDAAQRYSLIAKAFPAAGLFTIG